MQRFFRKNARCRNALRVTGNNYSLISTKMTLTHIIKIAKENE